MSTTRRRSAFTILEILMALAIGVMLLGALYIAVSMQMRSAQVGRQMMQQNTLVRSLFSRIDNDLNATVNQTDPARWRNQNISSTMSVNTATTSSNGIWTTSTILLPLGGFGPSDDQHLNVFVVRFPREAYQQSSDDPNDTNTQNQLTVSDLRRISYWFVQGKGLARQEYAQATSDDAQNMNAPPDDDSTIIAPEVTNVKFSYFDGTEWQDSWDGTQIIPSPDGLTPLGSPRAIKIMLEFELPRDEFATDSNAARKTKQYTHVILVNSASGPTPWNTLTATSQNGGGTAP
jgi:type II secretory pathway pseudopilin PulG